VVKYRKIPPAAAANQIAENARIPPAADLQKNNKCSLNFIVKDANIWFSIWSVTIQYLTQQARLECINGFWQFCMCFPKHPFSYSPNVLPLLS
jgi:hypothetical protein